MLKEQYFGMHAPRYMNFAGLGFIAGHELGHVIDHEILRKFAFYDDISKCLVNQYNNYTIHGQKVYFKMQK